MKKAQQNILVVVILILIVLIIVGLFSSLIYKSIRSNIEDARLFEGINDIQIKNAYFNETAGEVIIFKGSSIKQIDKIHITFTNDNKKTQKYFTLEGISPVETREYWVIPLTINLTNTMLVEVRPVLIINSQDRIGPLADSFKWVNNTDTNNFESPPGTYSLNCNKTNGTCVNFGSMSCDDGGCDINTCDAIIPVPKNCSEMSYECGSGLNDCGFTLNCGDCSRFGSQYNCNSTNKCQCTPSCIGRVCGDSDGCGGTCTACNSLFKYCQLGVCMINQTKLTNFGVTAYWPFDNDINDKSGNNRNFQTNNNVLFTKGKSGNATKFNGYSSYLNGQFNNGDMLNNFAYYTIILLVNSSNNFGFSPFLFATAYNSGYPSGYNCGPPNAHDRIPRIYIEFNDFQMAPGCKNSAWYDITFNNGITDNKWHFIAVVFSVSIGTKVFVDDQMQYNSGFTYRPESYIMPYIYKINQTSVGAGLWEMGTPPQWANFFNGSIDEIILFNKTLSDSEVRAIYQASL